MIAIKIIVKATNGKPDFGVAMKALMSNSEMKKHGVEVQGFLKTAMNRYAEISVLEINCNSEQKVLIEKVVEDIKKVGIVEKLVFKESKEFSTNITGKQ